MQFIRRVNSENRLKQKFLKWGNGKLILTSAEKNNKLKNEKREIWTDDH